MMRPAAVLFLLLATSRVCGVAQVNTVMLRFEDMVVRYADLAPNLLLTDTGTASGITIRGGEGATGIAAWADASAASNRGAGATNIGY